MSSTENALTAHIDVDVSWTPRDLTALEHALKRNFNLDHTTIQVEPAGSGPCPQGKEYVV
jgi:Co/Zn/Cd efflux system component